jgi:hypothetical protein
MTSIIDNKKLNISGLQYKPDDTYITTLIYFMKLHV